MKTWIYDLLDEMLVRAFRQELRDRDMIDWAIRKSHLQEAILIRGGH